MHDIERRPELTEALEGFLKQYYHEDLLTVANDTDTSLVIDWMDMFKAEPDLAEDFLKQPKVILWHIRDALEVYDLPVPIDISEIAIQVVNIDDTETYNPSDLRHEHGGRYVAIEGELARVTSPSDKPEELVYKCQRCGANTVVPQAGDELQDPYQCESCEREGPFKIVDGEGTWTDFSRVRIKTPPDESGELGQSHIDGYAKGELVELGHEDHGLIARAGEKCTVYGVVERKQKSGRNADETLFDRVLNIKAIDFDGNEKEVNIREHKDEFEELASRDDAVDIFAESLVPELYATPEWETALELAVAYLFAAPRIDIPQGPTYRGDIHALIVSDYGLGKSTVNSALAEFSPKSVKESVTGMSSEVGLLAASVKDDFGAGQWTIKPGILVRGNGGHVILDEIDKTDADLERMNDAIEGEQKVDINKAGQSVTYNSRVGLWATGNPVDSRFNTFDTVAGQLGIGSSLLSRFDGIVTMQDVPDDDIDELVAQRIGEAYKEAQEYEFGEREELELLDRVVDVGVGRAWIAYARENVFPTITTDQIEDIKDWYANELRPLNEMYGDAEADEDLPVPANTRDVEDTIRMAVAFARVELRDTVHRENLERAKSLKRTLIGQNFRDGEVVRPEMQQGRLSQKQRVQKIKKVLDGDEPLSIGQVAEKTGIEPSKVKNRISKLSQKGEVYQPENGKYQAT